MKCARCGRETSGTYNEVRRGILRAVCFDCDHKEKQEIESSRQVYGRNDAYLYELVDPNDYEGSYDDRLRMTAEEAFDRNIKLHEDGDDRRWIKMAEFDEMGFQRFGPNQPDWHAQLSS